MDTGESEDCRMSPCAVRLFMDNVRFAGYRVWYDKKLLLMVGITRPFPKHLFPATIIRKASDFPAYESRTRDTPPHPDRAVRSPGHKTTGRIVQGNGNRKVLVFVLINRNTKPDCAVEQVNFRVAIAGLLPDVRRLRHDYTIPEGITFSKRGSLFVCMRDYRRHEKRCKQR